MSICAKAESGRSGQPSWNYNPKKGEKLCSWAAFPYSAGANVFSFLMAGAAGTCANHNGRMSFHFKKILV